MPALFWGFVAIVVLVLGLALIALKPQADVSERRRESGGGAGGMWWATDVGSGDCGSGDCGDGGCD